MSEQPPRASGHVPLPGEAEAQRDELEIDPEARRVARENVKLNKLPQIEIPETQIEDIRDQYDVVVANIIDGVLINIKKDLLRVLKPGGHMLLTGILEERDNHFFEKFMENLFGNLGVFADDFVDAFEAGMR